MTSLMIIFWVVSGQTRVYAGLGHAGLAGGQGFSLNNKRLFTQIQRSIAPPPPEKKSAQGREFKFIRKGEKRKEKRERKRGRKVEKKEKRKKKN